MFIKKHNLQDATVLEIGRFAILWNWFEKYWCENNCNPTKIKRISKMVSMDVEKRAKFAKVLNDRRNWFGQLEADYVRDSLHPSTARESSEENMMIMRQFMEQIGDELTCGCLLILYRIRNNLMHGIKLFDELDGQIELFCAANAVLESINE